MPPQGTVGISASGFTDGSSVRFTTNINTVGLSVSLVWQALRHTIIGVTTSGFVDLTGPRTAAASNFSNGALFLEKSTWKASESAPNLGGTYRDIGLRALLQLSKAQQTIKIASEVLTLNRPTTLHASVAAVGGVTISLDISGFIDDNSRTGDSSSVVNYRWLDIDTLEGLPGTTAVHTLLPPNYVQLSYRPKPPAVRVIYEDGLGFRTGHTLSAKHLLPYATLSLLSNNRVSVSVVDTYNIGVNYEIAWWRSYRDLTTTISRVNLVSSNPANVLTISANYSYRNPVVRAGFTYLFRGRTQQFPIVTGESSPIDVGMFTGNATVVVRGSGAVSGSQYTADIGTLLDIMGRAGVIYEWQVASAPNGTWQRVGFFNTNNPLAVRASSSVYILDADDFGEINGERYQYLRARVANARYVGNAQTTWIESAPVNMLEQPLNATASISLSTRYAGSTARLLASAAVYPYEYQWQIGAANGNWQNLNNQTAQNYILVSGHFTNQRSFLRGLIIGGGNTVVSPSININSTVSNAAVLRLRQTGKVFEVAGVRELHDANINGVPHGVLNYSYEWHDNNVRITNPDNFYLQLNSVGRRIYIPTAKSLDDYWGGNRAVSVQVTHTDGMGFSHDYEFNSSLSFISSICMLDGVNCLPAGQSITTYSLTLQAIFDISAVPSSARYVSVAWLFGDINTGIFITASMQSVGADTAADSGAVTLTYALPIVPLAQRYARARVFVSLSNGDVQIYDGEPMEMLRRHFYQGVLFLDRKGEAFRANITLGAIYFGGITNVLDAFSQPVRDASVLGEFQWQSALNINGPWNNISGATQLEYTLNDQLTGKYIRLLAGPSFGYTSDYLQIDMATQQTRFSLMVDFLHVGATISIDGAFTDNNGVSVTSYYWQGVDAAGVATSIDMMLITTGGVSYGLLGVPSWNTVHVSLQAVAEVQDHLGRRVTFTTRAIDVRRPPDSEPLVRLGPGRMLSVILARDANNPPGNLGVVSYQWTGWQSPNKFNQPLSQNSVYVLSSVNSYLNRIFVNRDLPSHDVFASYWPRVKVSQTDGLGFVSIYTLSIGHLLPQVSVVILPNRLLSLQLIPKSNGISASLLLNHPQDSWYYWYITDNPLAKVPLSSRIHAGLGAQGVPYWTVPTNVLVTINTYVVASFQYHLGGQLFQARTFVNLWGSSSDSAANLLGPSIATVGASYTVQVSAGSDFLGTALNATDFIYRWDRGSAAPTGTLWSEISVSASAITAAIYTVQVRDFVGNNQYRYLRARAVHKRQQGAAVTTWFNSESRQVRFSISFTLSAKHAGAVASVVNPQASASYHWETGSNSHGNWRRIYRVTTHTYTLSSVDFSDDRQYLRLRQFVDGSVLYSQNVLINEQLASISGRIRALGGIRFEASLSPRIDPNDPSGQKGTALYQWYRGNTPIIDATSAIYSLRPEDYNNLPQVIMRYADRLGFTNNGAVTISTRAFGLTVQALRTGIYQLSATVTDPHGISDSSSYIFRWQQKNSNNDIRRIGFPGVVYNIPPKNYNVNFPSVRAELIYLYQGHSPSHRSNAAMMYSDFVDLRGFPAEEVVSITLMSGSGYSAGSKYEADVSGWRNIFGNKPSGNFDYRWQVGTSAMETDSSWKNIANANESIYALASDSFDAQYTYLRVEARLRADDFETAIWTPSAARNVQPPPPPLSLGITVIPSTSSPYFLARDNPWWLEPGGHKQNNPVYKITVSRDDGEDEGTVSYRVRWTTDNGTRQFTISLAETTAPFSQQPVVTADATKLGGITPAVQAELERMDSLGFIQRYTLTIIYPQVPSDVSVIGSGYDRYQLATWKCCHPRFDNTGFSIIVNIADINGVKDVVYEWEMLSESGEVFPAPADSRYSYSPNLTRIDGLIRGNQYSKFHVTLGWNTVFVSARVKSIITDQLGDKVINISAPFPIDYEPLPEFGQPPDSGSNFQVIRPIKTVEDCPNAYSYVNCIISTIKLPGETREHVGYINVSVQNDNNVGGAVGKTYTDPNDATFVSVEFAPPINFTVAWNEYKNGQWVRATNPPTAQRLVPARPSRRGEYWGHIYLITTQSLLSVLVSSAEPKLQAVMESTDALGFFHAYTLRVRALNFSYEIRYFPAYSILVPIVGIGSSGRNLADLQQRGTYSITMDFYQGPEPRIEKMTIKYNWRGGFDGPDYAGTSVDIYNPYAYFSVAMQYNGDTYHYQSPPILIHDLLVQGSVSIAPLVGVGLTVGSEWEASLVDPINLNTNPHNDLGIAYQWEVGSTSGEWKDIPSATIIVNGVTQTVPATSSVYTLLATSQVRAFNQDAPSLRVRISTPSKRTLFSNAADLSPQQGGELSITVYAASGGGLSYVSATDRNESSYYELSVSLGVQHILPSDSVRYEWMQVSAAGVRPIITDNTTDRKAKYYPIAGELIGENITLQARVIYTTPIGFNYTLSSNSLPFAQIAATYRLSLSVISPTNGGSVTVVGTVGDANGLSSVAYTWQGGNARGVYEDLASSDATSSIFVLHSVSWNPQHISLRARAQIYDNVAVVVTASISAVLINIETHGNLEVAPIFLPNTIVLSVNADALQDDNSGNVAGALSYQWSSGAPFNPLLYGQTEAMFTLNNAEIANWLGGSPPQAEVLYTDGLGFVSRHEVVGHFVGLSITNHSGNLTAVVQDPGNIADINGYQYQWLKSTEANGVYQAIVGETKTVYAVPVGYDASRNFVAVSLSYLRTVDNRRFNLMSAPRRVAGIGAGTVSLIGTGVTVDTAYTLSISVSDVLGRDIPQNQLRFEWHVGTVAAADDAGWKTITAISQSYTLAVADFSTTGTYLRAAVSHLSDYSESDAVLTAEAINLSRPAEGSIAILQTSTMPESVLSISISLLDENGAGITVYRWLGDSGSGYTALPNGDTSVYIIPRTPEFDSIIAEVEHTDALLSDKTTWRAEAVAVVAAAGNVGINIGLKGMTVTSHLFDDNAVAVPASFVYRWLQSETANGVYSTIAAAEQSIFIVLADYDATKPFLRVSLAYRRRGGDDETVLSEPLQVAGVMSGSLGIAIGGYAPNAEFRSDLTKLSDIVGEVPAASLLTYEWQRATAADSNTWEAIHAGQSYTLAASDFSSATTYLRLVASAASGVLVDPSVSLTAAVVNLLRPSNGALAIIVDSYQPEKTLTLDISNVSDDNGMDNISYQWQGGDAAGVYTNLPSGDAAVYIIPFSPRYVSIRAEMIYTDALFGEKITLTSQSYAIQAVDGTFDINLVLHGATVSAVLTNDNNILLNIGYRWQQGNADTFSFIDNAAQDFYVIPQNFDISRPFVRAHLNFQRRGSAISNENLFSAPLRVFGVDSGTLGMQLRQGDGFAADSEYAADLSNLRDVLGRTPNVTALTYQWQRGTVADSADSSWQDINAATSDSYVLSVNDFSSGYSYLRLMAADAVGYDSSSVTLISGAQDINAATEGAISISITHLQGCYYTGGSYALSAVYTAVTNKITDNNGIGAFAYEWLLLREGAESSVGAAESYTLAAGCLINPRIFLQVVAVCYRLNYRCDILMHSVLRVVYFCKQ